MEARAAAIQSGETVTGAIGLGVDYSHAGIELTVHETLPRPAPVALSPNTVHVNGEDEIGNVCTGSSANPTAPPGQLCVYIEAFALNATQIKGSGNSRDGFTVGWQTANAGGTTPSGFFARWAYTAP